MSDDLPETASGGGLAGAPCSAERPGARYLRALNLMMEAMDIVGTMPSRYSMSFRDTHDHFLRQLVEDALKRESQEEIGRKYPMGRHH